MLPQPHLPARAGPSKVAIPRLERTRNEPPRKPTTTKRPNRVSRACLNCRARKIRCDGAQPTCGNCRENSTQCVYASTRKDRLKTATEHNEEMSQFLISLRSSVAEPERIRIDKMLAQVAEDIADAASTLRKSPDKTKTADDEEEGETLVSGEVGSNADLDNMDEDLLRSEHSRATGYVGKNSEVQWLRQLSQQTERGEHEPSVMGGPYGPPGTGPEADAQREDALKQRQRQSNFPQKNTSCFNFNLDEESVDMNFVADPFDLPPLKTADNLVRCYMDSVHNSFPILAKKSFVNQFYHHYDSLARGISYKLPQKWQAMLNLVFAIGAVRSHLIEADWRADERDHFLYHSRAWSLGLKEPWWFSHPDLPQIQISGLLAIYYLSIGHTNRSWVVVGMAVRSAFSLGLHIRNEDRTATAVKKEILARIWWALYSLERLLSVITGRPSVGVESHSSAYLPLPISCDEIEESRIKAMFDSMPRTTNQEGVLVLETSSASSSRGLDSPFNQHDPANSGTYLTCTVKLGKVTQRVLNELYSPDVVEQSWKTVQKNIANIMGDLEAWAKSLPPGLDVFSDEQSNEPMAYERRNLKVFYYSVKMLISRPCICRLDRRIPHQSQSSSEFNSRMAATCVAAAQAIAALLPDDMIKERARVYEILPWWAAVYYIMQSLTILMLELPRKAIEPHAPNETVIAIKKLVRWLRVLRNSNRMAKRAHSIVLDLLQKMSVRIPVDISDLLFESQSEPIPSEHDLPQSDFFTEAYMTDDFLEQYSLQQKQQPQHYQQQQADYAYDTGAHLSPDFDFESGNFAFAPNMFAESHSNSLLTNLFLTGFDQQNPLSFGAGDVYAGSYAEDEVGLGPSGATSGGAFHM